MKILLVEDDFTIAAGIEYSLIQEEFEVVKVNCVRDAIAVIDRRSEDNKGIEAIDLFLIDLMLPDGSGYEICQKIKSIKDVPVIFLTACDEEVNVVMGLDMGADDYITKPFRVRELISRIKTVLRRYGNNKDSFTDESGKIVIGNITIKTKEAKVLKNNQEIELTALEYRLLLTMVNNKGNVLSRSQLLEGIWDVAGDYVNDNTLTVYVKRLRDKLEDDPSNPVFIETVRGMGYRIS